MKFKEGDKVIFNKKYIEENGLAYGGYGWVDDHIKQGNKPMTIAEVERNSDIFNSYGLIGVFNFIGYYEYFSIEENAILPYKNNIYKIGG